MRNEREHGDRHTFLAEARRRLATPVPENPVHPGPPAFGDAGPPRPSFVDVPDHADDPNVLIDVFVDALEAAGGACQVVDGDVPDLLLDELIAELEAWDVVVSAEPEARALGRRLEARGVQVHDATTDAAASAGLGITSARAAVAATGSIVLDSLHTGSRGVSVLPPVHLCVVPVDRIVPGPSDVLRPLSDDPAAVPPSLVLVTGPSRSGDIEQILTIGAHGPSRLLVYLVR